MKDQCYRTIWINPYLRDIFNGTVGFNNMIDFNVILYIEDYSEVEHHQSAVKTSAFSSHLGEFYLWKVGCICTKWDAESFYNILKKYIQYYNNIRPHYGIEQQRPKELEFYL